MLKSIYTSFKKKKKENDIAFFCIRRPQTHTHTHDITPVFTCTRYPCAWNELNEGDFRTYQAGPMHNSRVTQAKEWESFLAWLGYAFLFVGRIYGSEDGHLGSLSS